jgi:hypothetical protein
MCRESGEGRIGYRPAAENMSALVSPEVHQHFEHNPLRHETQRFAGVNLYPCKLQIAVDAAGCFPSMG